MQPPTASRCRRSGPISSYRQRGSGRLAAEQDPEELARLGWPWIPRRILALARACPIAAPPCDRRSVAPCAATFGSREPLSGGLRLCRPFGLWRGGYRFGDGGCEWG